jgi:hypothetical protein
MSSIYYKNGAPRWCATDKDLGINIEDLPWAPSDPNNYYAPEKALCVLNQPGEIGLADVGLLSRWNIICQASQ